VKRAGCSSWPTDRASVEEVAGGLQEEFERDHPEALGTINAGIDRFFDSLPARYQAGGSDLPTPRRQLVHVRDLKAYAVDL